MTCLCSTCKDMMAVPGHDLCRDCLDTAVEVFKCADPEQAYIQMMSVESAPPSGGAVLVFPGLGEGGVAEWLRGRPHRSPGVHTRGEKSASSLPGPDGSPSVCMFGTSWCNERNPCPDCVEFAQFPSGGEAA